MTNKIVGISFVLVLVWLVLIGVSFLCAYGQGQRESTPAGHKAECLAAARKILGTEAEIALCGHPIPGDGSLVTAALLRARQFQNAHKSALWNTPVHRIVILRRIGQSWENALDADIKQVTNPVGYISPDEPIDCSPAAFTADWSDQLADESQHHGIASRSAGLELLTLTAHGEIERGGMFTIQWNPAVGRFQKYDADSTIHGQKVRGRGFIPEEKRPPLMFGAEPCHCISGDCNRLVY